MRVYAQMRCVRLTCMLHSCRLLLQAMTKMGIQVQDDDLARMIDESDVHGKLWRVTVKNRLGEWGFTLKMTVREGVSELAYTSQDVFCRLGDKFTPLKVARLRGATPFEFAIDPPLPIGMSIDVKTGTIMGRPVKALIPSTSLSLLDPA